MQWPKFFQRQEKQSNGAFIHQQDHSYKSDKWEAYAKEGYGINPTVFTCINKVSKAFARIPLYVKVNGELVEDHPLKKLLDQPNPDEGGVEYRVAASSWMLLTGNNFQQMIMGTGQNINEIYNWQPYQFSVRRQKGNPVPLAYVFADNTSYKKMWKVDQMTGMSEIMHWRTFNPDPEDSTFGQAPLKAGASAVDQSNSARKWNYNTLENSASGSLMLTTEQDIDPVKRKQLNQDINEKYKGSKNANKFWLMGNGMKVENISMNQKDMEWLAGLKLNAQEIASVYDTPTQLIGIEGSQTYANFAEARLAFYTMAVLPLLELYISENNRWLAPHYGDNVEICYNKDDIEALEPLRTERRKQKIETGAYSPNEIREMFGDEPKPDSAMDVIYTDASKFPIGFDLFEGDEKVIEETAKSLMRMGEKPKEALQKAFDLYSDLQTPKD